MGGGGKGPLEKIKRCLWTVVFMLTMIASLLVLSAPVLIGIGDILVPCILIPSFTCVRCHSFREHLQRYGFRTSLMDLPIVSLLRSFIITCVYTLCDSPGLSHGPYLGTATLCSFVSILVLAVKACVFSATFEAEGSTSLARQKKLHLKKSWGMPVLFFSSLVFALGHMVVAYRTSCKARRKLLFHRVDPEAVLSCKSVFSSYQKVPRSPTPSVGKTLRSDSEGRRKAFGTARDEGELPIRLLAEMDSMFMPCQGLTLHYKLSFPESHPSHSAPTAFLDESPNSNSPPRISARLKLERPPLSGPSKLQHHHLQRSYSNQFPSSSLYAPLLEGSATSSVYFSEEIPVLSLDDANKGLSAISSMGNVETGGYGKLGIVLVHGFGGGVFSWRHVMGVLARRVGCTVAAFDRPGWGLTSRPQRKDWEETQLPNPYKLETQVDLLLSFCLDMGFSSVILVGHDDGGLLALKAAERVRTSKNSEYIKGVVLLGVSPSREVVPAFARILLRTSLGKKHLVRPLLRTEITQVVNRRAWYDCTKLTTEVLNLYKAPLCIEGWDEALHEICRLSFETVLSAQNAEALFKSVEDLPVLVVAGAEDALVSLKSSQVTASKLVNSRLVAISGCGHLPHEECPKALLAALLPFITRLLPPMSDHEQSLQRH